MGMHGNIIKIRKHLVSYIIQIKVMRSVINSSVRRTGFSSFTLRRFDAISRFSSISQQIEVILCFMCHLVIRREFIESHLQQPTAIGVVHSSSLSDVLKPKEVVDQLNKVSYKAKCYVPNNFHNFFMVVVHYWSTRSEAGSCHCAEKPLETPPTPRRFEK